MSSSSNSGQSGQAGPNDQSRNPQFKYLGVGHQSHDIHINADGERSDPEHGGASLYTALTAWLLTGERVGVVSATGLGAMTGKGDAVDGGTLETSADPNGPQTVFEDWIDGDFRKQRLVSRAPAIDSSFGALGHRGRNASTVFVGPLLDELPLDCRSWFWADFACLIPQGWFRNIHPDGSITLANPDVASITGPWDLIVLSSEEALVSGDLTGWMRLTRILAVTSGSHGATIYSEGSEHNVSAIQAPEVVDTTGAGDVWAAAFAIRYNETRNIQQAGKFASAAAAICVSRRGLRGVPESRQEVEDLIAKSGV